MPLASIDGVFVIDGKERILFATMTGVSWVVKPIDPEDVTVDITIDGVSAGFGN